METYGKAQRYGEDKVNLSMFRRIFDWGLGMAMYYTDFVPITWDLSARCISAMGLAPSRTVSAAMVGTKGKSWLIRTQIAQSLVWVGINVYFSAILSLPLDYYSNFVIEERHGFNKSTLALWIMDQLKTYMLISVLGGPILAGILKVIEISGRNFVPYLMGFT